MAISKTYSGDLTTSIAKRIYEAAVVGDAYRQDAKDIIDPEKHGVDDFKLGRGEFFGHALGAMATHWLPKRFQHQMPDLRGTDYLMRGQRRSLMTPFASPIDPKPTSAQAMARAGGRPFPFVAAETGYIPDQKGAKFTQKNDLFGLRSIGKKAVKVREVALGKFLAAIAESILKSLSSINKKVDDSEQTNIEVKEGIIGTHKALEDNYDVLESKLDQIIEALRTTNQQKRKDSDARESATQEAQLEQEADRSDAKEILMQDMDQREIQAMEERDAAEREADIEDNATAVQGELPINSGPDGDGFWKGGVADGPDSGYLAVLHGREAVVPLDNNFTRGSTLATNPILTAETGGIPGRNPNTMKPTFTPAGGPTPSPGSSSGSVNAMTRLLELPMQAASLGLMAVMGNVLSKALIPAAAIPGIKSIVGPIAGAMGISDIVTQNMVQKTAAETTEANRRQEASSPDSSGGETKNLWQRFTNWITGGPQGSGGSVRTHRSGPVISNTSIGGTRNNTTNISNSLRSSNSIAMGGLFGGKNPIEKLKFDPKQPDRPNPHPPGTTLYNIWEKHKLYHQMGMLGAVDAAGNDSQFFVKTTTVSYNSVEPPGSAGVVSNMINEESLREELDSTLLALEEPTSTIINNQNLDGQSDQQVEYSALAAKGNPFPAGFNPSPFG